MIRTILHHPDPRLRVKAEPVSEITPEVLQLIDDMLETMIANRGAGLAATQVGEAVRIFVMKDDLSCVAFINPKISGLSGEQMGAEGCLSLPGDHVRVVGDWLEVDTKGFGVCHERTRGPKQELPVFSRWKLARHRPQVSCTEHDVGRVLVIVPWCEALIFVFAVEGVFGHRIFLHRDRRCRYVDVKKTLREWLDTQGYLPRFMRDHHDQKDIFKWTWNAVIRAKERAKADGKAFDYLADMNWVSAHIFVIDYFLWFMAMHGYTLQPVRRDFDFLDWSESIKKMKDEEAEAFRQMFDKRGAPKETEEVEHGK